MKVFGKMTSFQEEGQHITNAHRCWKKASAISASTMRKNFGPDTMGSFWMTRRKGKEFCIFQTGRNLREILLQI